MASEEEDLHPGVVPAVVLQELEDARPLARVVPRRHGALQADLVRLALQLAAEAVDRRHVRELQTEPGDDVADLAQDVGAAPVPPLGLLPRLFGYHDAGGERSEGEPDRLVARAALELEGVAMGRVRLLVAQDHRQLRLVLQTRQEPRVHVDRAGGKGEGVEGRILDRVDPQTDRLLPLHLGRRQAARDLIQVVLQERVLVQRRLVAALALLLHCPAPQPALVADRRHAGRQAARLPDEERSHDQERRDWTEGRGHPFILPPGRLPEPSPRGSSARSEGYVPGKPERDRAVARVIAGRANYFFLNSASNAARPGLTFSPGGAAGPGLTMRRPVASRTVSGLKNLQVLAAVLEETGFGIGWRHSKRAPGSKCTQLRQQCWAARHFGQRASVGTLSRAGSWWPH